MQTNDISPFFPGADPTIANAVTGISGRNQSVTVQSLAAGGNTMTGDVRVAAAILMREEEDRALRRRALLGFPPENTNRIQENNFDSSYVSFINDLQLLELAKQARVSKAGTLANGNPYSSRAETLLCLSREANSSLPSFSMNAPASFATQYFAAQASPWNGVSGDEFLEPLISATPQRMVYDQLSSHGSLLLARADAANIEGNVISESDKTQRKAVSKEENEDAYFSQPMSKKDRFPVKLHRMIYEARQAGKESIVSFLPHGRAFAIRDKDRFVRDVLPHYFPGCQLPSFQKQLNLYGFHKITVGKDKGDLNYFHADFLRGRPALSEKIQRRRPRKAK